jgi:hypothetical protein
MKGIKKKRKAQKQRDFDIIELMKNSHINQPEVLRMLNYNTLGSHLKRGIVNFCGKISRGLKKPTQRFIADMVYGLIAGKSCFLTEIARKLNEKIALDKTVERLSRNLMNFEEANELTENYIGEVKKHFDESTVLIIDDGDVAKPHSTKLEGICRVRDGSTGELTDGYWSAGVSALTANQKQPIPVYSRIYSTKEVDYKSNNAETIKSLEFLSKHFPKENIRTLDRGYDGGYIFDYFIPRKESFIVRTTGNRNCIHNEKKRLISKLAAEYKGEYTLKFESKDGKKVKCKISIVPIKLPDYPDCKLNLVVCNGFGKEPLMLITNLSSNDDRLCLTITKVYLMRWRIEEYYRFKKQGFKFEKFLVRSLKSIRNLDLLLSVAIGHIGMLSEKVEESVEVMAIVHASKRLYGLSLFTFYAISDGLCAIFSKFYTGIQSFFLKPKPSLQLMLPGLG